MNQIFSLFHCSKKSPQRSLASVNVWILTMSAITPLSRMRSLMNSNAMNGVNSSEFWSKSYSYYYPSYCFQSKGTSLQTIITHSLLPNLRGFSFEDFSTSTVCSCVIDGTLPDPLPPYVPTVMHVNDTNIGTGDITSSDNSDVRGICFKYYIVSKFWNSINIIDLIRNIFWSNTINSFFLVCIWIFRCHEQPLLRSSWAQADAWILTGSCIMPLWQKQ